MHTCMYTYIYSVCVCVYSNSMALSSHEWTASCK